MVIRTRDSNCSMPRARNPGPTSRQARLSISFVSARLAPFERLLSLRRVVLRMSKAPPGRWDEIYRLRMLQRARTLRAGIRAGVSVTGTANIARGKCPTRLGIDDCIQASELVRP